MSWLVTKYLPNAGVVVVLVSEIARCSDRLGGFVAALPLVRVLVLIWPTLLACVILTVVLFGLLTVALRPFGIDLR